MFFFLKKITYLISSSNLKLLLIISSFVFVSLIEAASISLVGPFIYLANNPNSISDQKFLSKIYEYLDFTSVNLFIALLGLCIVFFYILKSFSSWKIQSYIYRFGYNQEAFLVKKLLSGYMFLPYTYHLSTDTSYILNAILGDVSKLATGVIVPTLTIISSFFVVLSLSTVLLISEPTLTLLSLLLIIPIFILMSRYKGKAKHWGAEISNSREEKSRIIHEAIYGIREVKVIGCEEYFEDRIRTQSKRYVNSISKAFSSKIAPRIMIETFFVTLLIVMTVLVLLIKGSATEMISTLGVFALVAIRFIPAFSQLANSLVSLRVSSYSVDKLYTDLKNIDDQKIKENKVLSSSSNNLFELSESNQNRKIFSKDSQYPLKNGSNIFLNVSNVSYTYPGSDVRALKNISFHIHKGDSVAFIGKSGAGKTTLLDVLLGLLTVEEGDVQSFGQSIYKDLRGWQNCIGYIPQTINLSDNSIAENIAFGIPKGDIDKARLTKCVETAQLQGVIERLPDGINTKVGERGVRLSGGQRQRIIIARALYHGSDVLVMDEATSSLDSETENLLTEAIKCLKGTKTIIVVAHRLSTIEHCNHIYLLDGGELIQQGSYEDVVLKQSINVDI